MSRVCCGRRSFAVAVYIRVRRVCRGGFVGARACLLCLFCFVFLCLGRSFFSLFGSCLFRPPSLSSLSLSLSLSLLLSLSLPLCLSSGYDNNIPKRNARTQTLENWPSLLWIGNFIGDCLLL